MRLKILGMNKIHYIEEWQDSRSEQQHTSSVEYYFTGVDECSNTGQLHLWEENGSCFSGWCDATWGNIESADIKIKGYTHVPIAPLEIDIDFNKISEDTKNELFELSTIGGDEWYPCGYVKVNEDLFKATPRYVDKPTIYIFKGNSGLGKSYLSDKVNMCKYETDSCEKLPEELNYNIIVLGNKYKVSIAEIIDRITIKAKIVIVDFKEERNETK